jgi:hypothetical protein
MKLPTKNVVPFLTALDEAHDLPDGPPAHAPEVQAWIALARAFQHRWVKAVDALPEDRAFGSLLELHAALGGASLADLGALTYDSADNAYEHVSKTKRVRWRVSRHGVLLRVTRPSVENWADPLDHEVVIDVQLARPHHADRERRILVDTDKIMEGAYGRRHVAIMHTALFSLVGIPGAFGTTKKQATILVKMLAAGAS